jgi:hypothetical protein
MPGGRHGRPIGCGIPEIDRQEAKIAEAMDEIRDLRRRTGRMTVDQLLSAHSAHEEGRSH